MTQRLLSAGGRIAIVSPSGTLAPELMEGGVATLTAAGYDVRIMPNAQGPREGVFSAPDALRAKDLADALLDPSVDVVWCARGGYGALRALDAMREFGGWRNIFSATDKMIVGFSDITALIAAADYCGKTSVHGPMLKHLANHGMASPDVRATLALLRGEEVTVERDAQEGSRDGWTEGRLIGGNLSILYSLAAAGMAPQPDGAILFVEDLSEYRYHMDRMMRSLRVSGFLERLSGVIVGRMTGMKDGATPFGRDAYQIVADAVADYGYPVFIGYPAGHADDENYPLHMGERCLLSVSGGVGRVRQSAARVAY